MEGTCRSTAFIFSVSLLVLVGILCADGCRAPVVEILVSPLVGKKFIRTMAISWDVGGNWRQGDWVGLYNQPPNVHVNPVFKANAGGSAGDARTGVQEGRKLGNPDYMKRCLGWWTAYWHANDPNPVVVSCLSSNPRWMEEMKHEIGNMRLNDMFIPGTHDSGSFKLAYSGFHDNRVDRYIYTQDETIMEQMIHGARLFDLRVANHKGKFWVNHGIARVHPLEYILNDIKQFVDSTNEIVILDFHEFPQGFDDPTTHHELIEFVRHTLGDRLAPPYLGWGTTLNNLWSMNKRIIFAYNDKDIARERANDVWWPVNQKWANKRKISDLYNYFSDIFNRDINAGVIWSAMAELTPNTWDVISDRLKGLRAMADETNMQVVSWFRGDWGSKANGVSVDFIRSTDIVASAIRWNRRRARRSMCD